MVLVVDTWDARLLSFRGVVVTLARETRCSRLDSHARPSGGPGKLPAGTRIRYVQTGYDSMRCDLALHTVEVIAGPDTGTWVDLLDAVGPGPLPWEE